MPSINICTIVLIRNPIFLCPGHPWISDHGVAPDRPLDPAVLSRIKQFSAMNKLKKMALQVRAFIFSLGGLYSFFYIGVAMVHWPSQSLFLPGCITVKFLPFPYVLSFCFFYYFFYSLLYRNCLVKASVSTIVLHAILIISLHD